MPVESSNFIFESLNGRPIPLLARDKNGELRVVDNRRYFSLEQAAAFFAIAPENLREIWMATWGEFLPAESASPLAEENSELGIRNSELKEADGGAGSSGSATGAARAGIPDIKSSALMHSLMYPQLDADQFKLFIEMCQARRLNPWCRHLFPRVEMDPESKRVQLTIITTIDAMWALAGRTGEFEGVTLPQWCDKDRQWQELLVDVQYPYAAKVGAKRRGREQWAMALWSEYAPFTVDTRNHKVYGPFWEKMPMHMLGKCAEALALRKTFPEELGGLYALEEVQRGILTARQELQTDGGAGGAARGSADPPASLLELKQALRERDMEPAEISQLLGDLEREHANMSENDPGAFYALVWYEATRGRYARRAAATV